MLPTPSSRTTVPLATDSPRRGPHGRPGPRAFPRRLAPLHALLLALLLAATATAGLAQAAPPPERVFEVLEQALAEQPRARFDFAAALADVGEPSVAAIFEWVRSETGFVAYRGALKGALGTLIDREGNSLDRALLLERLLEEAGFRAIVARATLSGAALEAAVAAQRRAPAAATGTAANAPAPGALAERAAAELGLDQEALLQRLDAAKQNAARLSLNVERAAGPQSAALLAELQASEAGSSALAALPTAAERAALLADHWWIQVELDGAWVDLDPTLPGASVGDTLAPAETRFDLPELRFLAAVDGACRDLSCGDRLHRVNVAVVIETWDGESLSERELTSSELLAAEGAGRGVAFAALPVNWPEELDLYGVAAPLEQLRAALLETDAWQPALFVGEASFGTSTVSAAGKVSDRAGGGGAAGNAGMLGGGLGGMFGGTAGGTAGADGAGEGAFTALWLDYTVHTPGEGEERHRREVFDLVGPAARAAGVTSFELSEDQRLERALALSGQTAIVVSGAGQVQGALAAAAAARLLDERQAWSELYHQGQQLDPALLAERLTATAGLFPPLDVFQVRRGERLQGYASGAFVAAFHRRFSADFGVTGSFDLVTGAVAALPAAANAATARLEQGVLDTVLEAELAAQFAAATPSAAPAAPNVAEAFVADMQAGRVWRLVTSGAELAAAAPALAPDLSARVLMDLAEGRLALVPPGGGEAVGWYSFDPRTGALLGRGERGWGQATSESAVTTNVILQLRTAINQYASMARCLGLALTGPLRGLTAADHDPQLQECVFTTICSMVNTGLSAVPNIDTNWTNVIMMASIDALWGGTPEVGFGGLCGGLWKKLMG